MEGRITLPFCDKCGHAIHGEAFIFKRGDVLFVLHIECWKKEQSEKFGNITDTDGTLD